MKILHVFLFCFSLALALNNGLGRTPQMGYNSWYDVLMTPTEDTIKQTVQALKKTGLYDLGYKYINLDDGMVAKRSADGILMPDPVQFPSGFKALADYIHGEGMLFGVYTDRGPTTCGGRPAAQGHELTDARTYAEWGVDYVKEDSCNAPTDHQVAFNQYATMRDALNSTGRPIFFSLCGWNNWYAPVGHVLGNSWRIGPDDTTWANVLVNIDLMAPLYLYAGPGGWNDPCLLLGRDSTGKPMISDQQGRLQFTMWAIMSAPLLLSQNVRNLSAYQLETYSNPEVIAISQDPLGRQGQRLVGGPLASSNDANPHLTLQPCHQSGSAQTWNWNVPAQGFLTNLDTKLCANADDCGTDLIAYQCVTSGGTCAGPQSYANEQFVLSDGVLRSALSGNLCVTSYGLGHPVSLAPCSGLSTQKWQYNMTTKTISNSDLQCLSVGGTASSKANIWGKPLADGSWVFAFLNVGPTAVSIECNATCMSVTGWEFNQKLAVRDLWVRYDLPSITSGLGIGVRNLQQFGVTLLKLTPIWKAD